MLNHKIIMINVNFFVPLPESSVPSVEILGGAPLAAHAAHPALGCDHGVISQSLVPRKEEGLSKKIPPWDATEASRRAPSTAIETEVERGVIKCPLHFLQEAFITPQQQLNYTTATCTPFGTNARSPCLASPPATGTKISKDKCPYWVEGINSCLSYQFKTASQVPDT